MKYFIFVLTNLFFLLFYGCQNVPSSVKEKSYPVQLPIIDDFNRADNANAGAPWFETEISNYQIRVSNNMLVMSWGGIAGGVWVQDIKPFGNHKVAIVMKGENAKMMFDFKISDITSMNGYTISLQDTGLFFEPEIGGSAGGITKPFSYTQGHVYQIAITAMGPVVSLMIADSNTSVTNNYVISNNVASSYDYMTMFGGFYFNSNSTSVDVDSISIEEL